MISLLHAANTTTTVNPTTQYCENTFTKMHWQHGERGPAFIQNYSKMCNRLSNYTNTKTLHNEAEEGQTEWTLKPYLTKFLLYVGVDVDVIHTVRHFLLACRSLPA